MENALFHPVCPLPADDSVVSGHDPPEQQQVILREAHMEKRQHPRVRTFNLISFVSVDSNGKISERNMGKALNISQSGLFLETPNRVLSESISMMSVDANNNLIEIKGEVIYSAERSNGRFGAGVRFMGSHAENIQFAMKLIRAFNTNKYKAARAANLQASG